MNSDCYMKKIAMLLFLFSTTLHAQEGVMDGPHLYYGITLGGDLGTETDGVYALEGQFPGSKSEQSMRLGFAGGLQFDYVLNQSWTLSAGMLYDQKGTELTFRTSGDGDYSDVPVTTDVTLNYLEIPLLVKWTPGAFFFFAGPSVDFFLSGTAQNLSGVIPWNTTIPLYHLHEPCMSAIAGIGLRFHFGNVPASLSALYDYGLTNDALSNQAGYGYAGAELYGATSRDIRLMMSILFWNN
jgi:Outer membrane protein beta-barrel domain